MIGKESYKSINSKLHNNIKEKGTLIVSHRGCSGANIIENTIPAYKAAILENSDILEVDVIQSKDGVFYTFHDGTEKRLLNESDNIKTMDSKKIDNLSYINGIGHKTNYKVERLDDVLRTFKGESLFNLDRSWDIWPELLTELDKHDVLEQIILKGPVNKEYLDILESHSNKYMFMPIVHSPDEIEVVLNYQNINVVGMELIADSEEHPLFQDDIISKLKRKNLLIFANALTLDDNVILFATFDDNKSIIEGPDLGWGKLFDKGIDIIQTDWPALLSNYRDERIKI